MEHGKIFCISLTDISETFILITNDRKEIIVCTIKNTSDSGSR